MTEVITGIAVSATFFAALTYGVVRLAIFLAKATEASWDGEFDSKCGNRSNDHYEGIYRVFYDRGVAKTERLREIRRERNS